MFARQVRRADITIELLYAHGFKGVVANTLEGIAGIALVPVVFEDQHPYPDPVMSWLEIKQIDRANCIAGV